jgi:hypothetical protein
VKLEIKAVKVGPEWSASLRANNEREFKFLHSAETLAGCLLWVFAALDLPSAPVLFTVETGENFLAKVSDAS